MTKARLDGLYLRLLGSALFVSMGSVVERTGSGKMEDFKVVYYQARCLLQHGDPYKPSETLRAYRAEGGKLPRGPLQDLTPNVYPPTASIFIAPFSILPWAPAHLLWMIFTAGSFILASYLMWDLGADHAPLLSGCLVSFLLANSISLLIRGNPAGIAISFCMVAVWCFLRDRFAWAGVLCLAVSLALKPHDAGLVRLYFLLAGAPNRKRALQTLLVTAVLGLAAIVWVTPIAPHWVQELHSNLLVNSAPGGNSDPGPASGCSHTAGMVIDLQSVISIFRDDPRIYNPASYLVCGALLLVWSFATLLLRFFPARARVALAAIIPLTLLVTYHRTYDAKLLLLAVPACTMLWAEGGLAGRLALVATTVGVISTGDYPLTILYILTENPHWDTAGLFGKTLSVALTRPVPLILLIMGIFYLWIYVRRHPGDVASLVPGESDEMPLALTPS